MMPSPRRMRLLMTAAIGTLITIFFFTSRMRSGASDDSRLQGFYEKTMNAMDNSHGGGQVVVGGQGTTNDPHVKDKDGDGSVDEDDEQLTREMSERLRAAEQRAKDLANQKAPLPPDPPQKVVGIGSSAGGQNKKGKSRVDNSKEDDNDETEADSELETTMDAIFKRSPVVIFSKSYCPYSKRAKGILLEKYSIDPPPYVVELDEHPLGAKIQARLGALTQRTTVPNIMVNGKSIGGGDEISELDGRKTLIDKIKSVMGAKQITMKERFNDKSKEI